MKSETRDSRIHWLPREVETGHIEYKYRLCTPNPTRMQQLVSPVTFYTQTYLFFSLLCVNTIAGLLLSSNPML